MMRNESKKDPEETPDPKNKMYKTFNNESIIEGISLKNLVIRCGELLIPYEEVCWLCRELCDPHSLNEQLNDTFSEAYAWYQTGVVEGKLKLNIELEYNIGDPKVKDAYKSLSTERSRQKISQKIKEMFGL